MNLRRLFVILLPVYIALCADMLLSIIVVTDHPFGFGKAWLDGHKLEWTVILGVADVVIVVFARFATDLGAAIRKVMRI